MLRLGVSCAVVAACGAMTAACGPTSDDGSALHAQKVALQREVDGMRAIAVRLERGEPMLPVGDVAIAIDDSLVRDILAAQLPFDADVDRYHLSLQDVDVSFRGSPVVRLRGTLNHAERPDLLAQVNVVGALENIAVNASASTLTAGIAIDHLGIEKVGGLEAYLSGSTLDEIARTIRDRIRDQMPPVQIPVRVQQTIDLPAVTRGPVRIGGARLPLAVAVSQVMAVKGTLWIAVHFAPGDVVKTDEAPAARDATAAETGASLGGAEEPASPRKGPVKAPGKGT